MIISSFTLYRDLISPVWRQAIKLFAAHGTYACRDSEQIIHGITPLKGPIHIWNGGRLRRNIR